MRFVRIIYRSVVSLLLLMAICLIVRVTCFRPSTNVRLTIVPFLASYRAAWNSMSTSQWMNLLFNIILFVPFGFLLPAAVPFFRKLIRTVLVGALFSAGIEAFQFIETVGVTEVDDLLNNTYGTLIGYCAFVAVREVILLIRMHGVAGASRGADANHGERVYRGAVLRIAASFLPVVAMLLSIAMVQRIYHNQQYGNFSSTPSYRINMSKVKLVNEIPEAQLSLLPDGEEERTVYRSVTSGLSKEEALSRADALAEELFGRFGTKVAARTEKQEAVFADELTGSCVYISEENADGISWNLSVDLENLTFSLHKKSTNILPENTESLSLSEGRVRELLHIFGFEIPEGTFEKVGASSVRFTVFQKESDGLLKSGECTVYLGSGTINQPESASDVEGNTADEAAAVPVITGIDWEIVDAASAAEETVISAQEAIDKIYAGDFKISDARAGRLSELTLTGLHLNYGSDSKGYLRAVYAFSAENDGDKLLIIVPATAKS